MNVYLVETCRWERETKVKNAQQFSKAMRETKKKNKGKTEIFTQNQSKAKSVLSFFGVTQCRYMTFLRYFNYYLLYTIFKKNYMLTFFNTYISHFRY